MVESFQACTQIGVVSTAMMDAYDYPLGAKQKKASCM